MIWQLRARMLRVQADLQCLKEVPPFVLLKPVIRVCRRLWSCKVPHVRRWYVVQGLRYKPI